MLLLLLMLQQFLTSARTSPAAFVATTAPGADAEPRSVYADSGHVQPFLGDVTAPAALWLALQARSFRQELILMGDLRVDNAHQAFSSLAALGLLHVMFISADQLK